jgi:signal transduction histidine kinase
MKLRAYVLILLAIVTAGTIGLFMVSVDRPSESVDYPAMNDVVMRLQGDFDTFATGRAPLPECTADYVLFSPDGRQLAATADGLAPDFSTALRARYTIIDVVSASTPPGTDIILGRAAFASPDPDVVVAEATARQRTLVLGVLGATLACVALLLWRVYVNLLRPFQQMRGFARRVASGDLDTPLAMDRGNAFGAFTESFDLMRDQLAASRAREAAAQVSKKELVASLSHDIKTPVASIKAVAELGQARSQDATTRQQFATIDAKADQIDSLITNMFSATLDDLESLDVTLAEVPSTELARMITDADHRHLISADAASIIPGCLIVADPLRLTQVVDNVIANSYKYAGTPIELKAGSRTTPSLCRSRTPDLARRPTNCPCWHPSSFAAREPLESRVPGWGSTWHPSSWTPLAAAWSTPTPPPGSAYVWCFALPSPVPRHGSADRVPEVS